MIISHKYKFIFLKTRKTAGTSVEISLSRFCGENDIITPILPQDEVIRKQLGVFPKNYLYNRPLELKEYQLPDFRQLLFKFKQPQLTTKFYNHISAQDVKKAIGKKIWDNYFKFCFVRNPWDRAISWYYWNMADQGKIKSLDETLRYDDPYPNWDVYTIDNQVAVDYVGKYENLMEDLCYVCNKLEIPFDQWLPKTKGKIRKDKRHYSEILTVEQADFISKRDKKEIELFSYKF